MLNKNNKNKFSIVFFVIVSLLVFCVAFFGMIFLSAKNSYYTYQKDNINNKKSDNKYFLNKNYSHDDPYMTKIPNLKDMLRGPIINKVDPAIGNQNAKVFIVQFSDFACEYCYNQEKEIKKILEKYKDQVMMIWKDYPENNLNSESYQSAIYARCAQEQNKFWEFHDELYKNIKNLNKQTYYKIAKKLKLNLDEFDLCIDSKKVKNLINDNILEANALNINGIPFIYINDQEIMGEINFEDLEKIIELEINRNNDK